MLALGRKVYGYDLYGSFSKSGGLRDPKGYRGIIRGLYRGPLRDYIGVIVRNTHIGLFGALEWVYGTYSLQV